MVLDYFIDNAFWSLLPTTNMFVLPPRIRDSLKVTVSTVGLRTLISSVRRSDLSELQHILDHNIPELRRKSTSSSTASVVKTARH